MADWTLITDEGFWGYLLPGVLLGFLGMIALFLAVFMLDIKTIKAVRATATIGFVLLLTATILLPIGINKDTLGNSLTSLPEGSYQLVGVFKINDGSTDQPGPHLHVVIRGAAEEQRSVELPLDAYILVDGKKVSGAISSFPDAFMGGGVLKVYYDNRKLLDKKGGHEWQSEEVHTQKIKMYHFVGATAYPVSPASYPTPKTERDTPD